MAITTVDTELPDLPGVHLERVIDRGVHGVVVRGRRGGRPVAVKLQPARGDAVRFWREASTLARLRHDGLPRLLDAGEAGGHRYIVQQLFEDRPLARALAEGALPVGVALAMARALADMLVQVHRLGLVHRDVTPSNVLWGPDRTALVDFGVVERASDRAVVSGTPGYAAPEQTGMIDREVDGRADLYSVGVLMFEALCGAPPFMSDEPAALLRMHASVPAPDLRERSADVPGVVADIVAKLLAKDPDDRYQTAAGLRRDLDRLIGDEPLDGLDRGGRPSSGHPLVGRDEEIAALGSAWASARDGKGTAALVTGRSGVGKSRLVQHVVDQAPVVWTAKCDAADQRPLAPIRRALDAWLGTPGAPAQVRAAAGADAALFARLGGGLAEALGVSPAEAAPGQGTLLDALARLLVDLARRIGPLVWFLDDVQWLDSVSIDLLSHVGPRMGGVPLCLIAAARSGAAHTATVGAVARAIGPALARRIEVGPLDRTGLASLVAAELGERPIDARLLEHLEARTQGLPFAIHENVRAMLDGAALRPSADGWTLDREALRSLDLPRDVLDLVLRRIEPLDDQARAVCRAAAILGPSFRGPVLAPMTGASLGECDGALRRAARAGLVESEGRERWSFAHDRVWEALLADVDDIGRAELHRAASRALRATGDTDRETVYATARHGWLARLCGSAPEDVDALLVAARLAAEEAAFAPARELYLQAAEVAASLDRPLDATFAAECGEACAKAGQMDDATAWLSRALSATDAPVAAAEIHLSLALVHLSRLDTASSDAHLHAGMRLAGAPPPVSRALDVVRAVLALVWGWTLLLVPALRSVLSDDERRRRTVLGHLYRQIGVAAYFEVDTAGVVLAMVRSWPNTLRLGPGLVRARWAAQASTVYGLLGRRRQSRALWEEASRIAGELGDAELTAYVNSYDGHRQHFLGDTTEAAQTHRETLTTWGGWMENVEYLTVCANLSWNLVMRGYAAEAKRWIDDGMARIALTPSALGEGHTFRCYAGPTLSMLGRTAEAKQHLAAYAELLRDLPFERWRNGQHLAHTALHLVLEGQIGEPVEEAFERFLALGLSPRRTPLQLCQVYVALAYARLERLSEGEEGADAALTDAIRRLERARPHATLQAHLWVVRAGRHVVRGEHDEAETALVRAARLGHATDNPWVLHGVHLWRASLLRRQGRVAAGLRSAQFAWELAVGHGWVRMAHRVRAWFPGLDVSDATHRDTSDLQLRAQLDALLQVGRASAGVLDVEEKARVVLDEVVRLVGAERGLLYVQQDGALAMMCGRDAHRCDLEHVPDASDTVVQRVIATQQPVVLSGVADGVELGSQSVVAHDLRSVAAAPLKLGDRVVGVLYLDTRLARGAYTRKTGELLAALASHLALGLETARATRLEVAVEAERQANALLEERVTQRTEALHESLRQLESEVERRRQAQLEAQAASRAKSRFLANMSHELRTPLNAILGYAEMVQDEVEELGQPSIVRDLERVRTAGRHLLSLIDDVLDLARIEADDLVLQASPVDLAPLVEEALDTVRPLAAERSVELGCRVAAGLGVVADRERLSQVLLNLLGNAIKFAGGGRVAVDVEQVGADVTIAVSDTGIGIAPEHLERVFERFQQVDDAPTRAHDGSGLGLAISRDLVERMGGRLTVQSTPGEGSTFTITLPSRT